MVERELSGAARRNADAIARLEAQSGVALQACYQCGKCAAGCPMAEGMDLMPRQVIRYLQLGLLEEALAARSPWICASCHTCSARCPHQVNIADLMESVRQEADRRGLRPVRTVSLFTGDFLRPVRWFGRAHELTMTAFYNLSSGHLLQNFRYLPKMIRGGKLAILPHTVRDRKAVRRLIQNCQKEAAQK